MKQIQEKWRILGIGLCCITVLLILFNSSEKIHISWFWVLSPFWFLIIGFLIFYFLELSFPLIRKYLKFKKKMKIKIKEKWWEK